MVSDGYVSRLNSVQYDARSERLMGSVLHLPNGSGAFSARGGRRVHGAGLQVSVGGSSPEQVTVTAGAGVVSPGTGSTGPYAFEIPAAVVLALPARPGTGLSRIDLIVARIYDVDEETGPGREVKIERVSGDPGASPTAPAQPALSLLLATLTVPSGGTISVTAATARTVAAGGILPVAGTSQRDALTPFSGLAVWNEANKRLEVHDGTAWSPLASAGAGFIKRTGAGQSVANGTSYVKLRTGTAKVSDDSLWTYSSTEGAVNQYEYTCVRPGAYRFVVVTQWASNASGRRGIGMFLNGTQQPEGDDGTPSGNYNFRQTAVYEDTFAAGDRVGAQVLQTSGDSLVITASAVSITRIGA